MRLLSSFVALSSVLMVAVPVSAQRQWIIHPTRYEGDGWVEVASGDYDSINPSVPSRPYKYASGWHGSRRVYWEITAQNCIPVGHNDPFPVKPSLYAIEQWDPATRPQGVTWNGWTVIDVDYSSGDIRPNSPFIHWNGAYGTNYQWIQSNLDCDASGTCTGGPEGAPARWHAAGPGPHAPNSPQCNAGTDGIHVWIKRGSKLYIKWDYSWSITAPGSTLRLTEMTDASVVCEPMTANGQLDLRCVGNADPVYGPDELFANDPQTSFPVVAIDSEWAFAVSGYAMPLCPFPEVNNPQDRPTYPWNVQLPMGWGLPTDGQYIAHLPDRNVPFKIRFDGFNTIKWRTGNSEFDPNRVFSLNESGEREFTPGNYKTISLLTASSGGLGHRLNVEAFYNDGTIETTLVNLYDWFGQSGDANSVAVGVDGVPRSQGGQGFRLLSKNADSDSNRRGGEYADGAYFVAHTIPVNVRKTLTRVDLSLSSPTAPTFVVEAREGGRNHANFSSSGSWSQDAAKSTAGETTAGIGSLRASPGQAGTTATFSFTPTVTAYYDVFVTWANNLNQACTKTAFIVTSDNEPVTLLRNQRNDGNGWRHLGQFPLTAGNTYSVTIDSGQSSDGSAVYADGARWQIPGITANVLAATFETGVACPEPWADADEDMDVDADDFAVLQQCLTLDGVDIQPGCECFDANRDGRIDLNDITDFAACAMGPGVQYVHEETAPHWPNWPAECPGQPAE